MKIPSTPIPTFAAFWFASAPIVRVRVRRLGRSGGSEQPQEEVRQVVASVALCLIRRMLCTQTFRYPTVVHFIRTNEDMSQDINKNMRTQIIHHTQNQDTIRDNRMVEQSGYRSVSKK